MTFCTFVLFFTVRSGQSTPVTLEQKSRHSAGSTRKNLATATACSLSISSECCCDGLPFCTISIFTPGTAASIRDLISSKDSKLVTKVTRLQLLQRNQTVEFIEVFRISFVSFANTRRAVSKVTQVVVDENYNCARLLLQPLYFLTGQIIFV